MSMMDTMNAASQQPAAGAPADPAASQAPQGPSAAAPSQFARLSEGGDLQGQFNKVMKLASSQLWEKGMSDLVNEQLIQDESEPSAVVGKFVSFLLNMANAAFNSKQQAPEPIVMIGVAEQMADQMTDIALNNETVAPEDADDTSEAAALIGLSLFLENSKSAIQQEDLGEYQQIITQIINNAPGAAKMAQDNIDDAEDVQTPDENNEGDPRGAPEGMPTDQPPAPQGGMAAAMGGQ